jgi:hypothetical protein
MQSLTHLSNIPASAEPNHSTQCCVWDYENTQQQWYVQVRN